jgi:hypothetical protein
VSEIKARATERAKAYRARAEKLQKRVNETRLELASSKDDADCRLLRLIVSLEQMEVIQAEGLARDYEEIATGKVSVHP